MIFFLRMGKKNMSVKEYVLEDTFIPTLLQIFSSLTAFSLTFAVAKTFDLVVTTKKTWIKLAIIWGYVISVFTSTAIILIVFQETKEVVEVRKQVRYQKLRREIEEAENGYNDDNFEMESNSDCKDETSDSGMDVKLNGAVH